jgi:hypothetical protein
MDAQRRTIIGASLFSVELELKLKDSKLNFEAEGLSHSSRGHRSRNPWF